MDCNFAYGFHFKQLTSVHELSREKKRDDKASERALETSCQTSYHRKVVLRLWSFKKKKVVPRAQVRPTCGVKLIKPEPHYRGRTRWSVLLRKDKTKRGVSSWHSPLRVGRNVSIQHALGHTHSHTRKRMTVTAIPLSFDLLTADVYHPANEGESELQLDESPSHHRVV